MPNTIEVDATVTERYSVTVPASIREEADLEPGDRLRWRVTDAGDLEVEVIKRRRGGISDLEPVDVGEEMNVPEDHDVVAGEF